ncbi:MAG: HAMP domain-containing sensor histidine kinase, partial [Chthoniobacteraceae bacterium]
MQIEHSEFQDQLVRGLAHRMNNILTLFHGYLGLLLDNKKLDKSTLEGLAKIQHGARAASDLMDRTHSLVRASTAVWRELDLSEMLIRLRPTLAEMAGPKVTLQVRCLDETPRVWADVGRIKTAIVEVIRNACDATAGGGTVSIELKAGAAPPAPTPFKKSIQWLSLTITDDGPGIPKDALEKIFTPFYTARKKGNATGLGLTVALGFVQQHGGVIRVRSAPKKTVFQILLPA